MLLLRSSVDSLLFEQSRDKRAVFRLRSNVVSMLSLQFSSSKAVKYSIPVRSEGLREVYVSMAFTDSISASLNVPSEFLSKFVLTYERKLESGKVDEVILTEAYALEHINRQKIRQRRCGVRCAVCGVRCAIIHVQLLVVNSNFNLSV